MILVHTMEKSKIEAYHNTKYFRWQKVIWDKLHMLTFPTHEGHIKEKFISIFAGNLFVVVTLTVTIVDILRKNDAKEWILTNLLISRLRITKLLTSIIHHITSVPRYLNIKKYLLNTYIIFTILYNLGIYLAIHLSRFYWYTSHANSSPSIKGDI